jgi:hypothetical protein
LDEEMPMLLIRPRRGRSFAAQADGACALRASAAVLSLLLLWLSGCATTKVEYEFDQEADFSRYVAFAWIDPAELESPPALARRPLVDKRVRLTIEEALIGRGHRKVEAGEADFLIIYNGALEDRLERIPLYGPHGAVQIGSQTRVYHQGTLVLDVYDARTKKLTWRGWATDVFDTREEAIEELSEIVDRLLSGFPPK